MLSNTLSINKLDIIVIKYQRTDNNALKVKHIAGELE